ncbi:putative blue (type 1) copper domain protein [Candidatus Nitrososphaera gargensis Ga9.2]|uniref:Putative blue (Type 1) copper domain protein n=1 Tax=Nitrososphaera gargensis (strain Ga9.2) TaxID=1237085 RepID=K0IKY1_NITGG|nr:plastocyanin/azurin family copper-binding protein [Candidatus Nitrososphaera gargensis]AFU59207.1 putative blue (type 1) copper domain protein [Candidatus Nitrososphaera gargensis Ga9.2]
MNNRKIVLLAGLSAAIIAGTVLVQPSIYAPASGSYNATTAANNDNNSTSTTTSDDSELTTFEEEAIKAGEEFEDNNTTATTSANATASNETSISNETTNMDQETSAAAATGDNKTIVLQGTVSSPGEEAGPFQIIDLLPPTLDGNIYTGWVSFTATKPILVAPLHTYNVANETLDPRFGELFVFPGIPNGTMIAPAITMPDYATQNEINSDIPMPKTYSATVPFTASGLSVGRLDGKQFLVSYTLYATVHLAETVDNVDSAITNQTQVKGIEAIIVSRAAFLNDTAYSPNPIEIKRGDTVTWVNKDFDQHTVTSGSFGEKDAGDEFDSGYMGPQTTFSHTFKQKGEFEYFCELHPNMGGVVKVE